MVESSSNSNSICILLSREDFISCIFEKTTCTCLGDKDRVGSKCFSKRRFKTLPDSSKAIEHLEEIEKVRKVLLENTEKLNIQYLCVMKEIGGLNERFTETTKVDVAPDTKIG